MQLRGWAFVLMALVVVTPLTADAAEGHHAKFLKLVKKGEALYQAGRYQDAAAMLQQAYAVEANPRVLYNIARALDQAGELQSAMESYKRYVSSEQTDPTLLQRANLAIDRIRALQDKQDAEAKRQAEDKARAEAETRAAEERAKAEAEAARKAREDAEAQRRLDLEAAIAARHRSRVAAYSVGAVGVAATGAGVVFGVLANSSHNQFSQATTAADKDSLASTTRTRALVADVGYGAAVVALAVAVLLYPKGHEPGPVTLVPAPGGLGLAASF